MAKNYNVSIEKVAYFDKPERTIAGHTLAPASGIQISWIASVGWGQLTIYQFKDGSIVIDSECMSKDFVKQVLNAYRNYILNKGVIE
jgi:hypothetical protein